MMGTAMNVEQRRMHWRCRRGMLELDLLFQNFTERYLCKLDSMQTAALDELLDLPDNDLWDLLTYAVPSGNMAMEQVLIWLRNSKSEYTT